MVAITRSVGEFDQAIRRVLEHALGVPLRSDQRLMIQLIEPPNPPSPAADAGSELPEWCHVYEGLTDDQIAKLEQIVLERANLSRAMD